MAIASAVKLVLRGSFLKTFLRKFSAGVRSSEAWHYLRGLDKLKHLNNQQISHVYRIYKGILDSGSRYNNLDVDDQHFLNTIQINPYLDVLDPVMERVTYFVEVTARFKGERSKHSRLIEVHSWQSLTRAELEAALTPRIGEVTYTRSGKLGSQQLESIQLLEMTVLGVSRIG